MDIKDFSKAADTLIDSMRARFVGKQSHGVNSGRKADFGRNLLRVQDTREWMVTKSKQW